MRGLKNKTAILFVPLILILVFTATLFSSFAAEESSIESIRVEKFTRIKNYDGEVVRNGDRSYFLYNTDHPSRVTVSFKDGKSITDSFEAIEAYFGAEATFSDSQSAENPWTVGSYKASYSFMGFEGEYTVEIIETPVEKITVQDINLYYKGKGYYGIFHGEDGNVFYYDSEPEEMTVYFKDGSTLSGTAESLYEKTGYLVNVLDSQSLKSWEVGKHPCKAEFMGVSTEYYANVISTPVKSIMVDDIILYEGIDGEYQGNDFYFDAKPQKVSVFYKNTGATTGTVEEIEKETGYQVSYETEKNWESGKKVATASFLGVSAKFVAEVRPDPISDVRLIRSPDKTEYYEGEIFDIKGAAIRVYYSNGKTEDVAISVDYEKQLSYVYLSLIKKTVYIDSFKPIQQFYTDVNIGFSGTFFNIGVSVKDTIEKMELAKDKNGFPYIRFLTSEGAVVTARVINAIGSDFNAIDMMHEYPALLVTQEGMFIGSITKKLDGYRFSVYGADIPVTVACDGINWAESAIAQKAKIIYNNYQNFNKYNGLVGSDNIDQLLSYAVCMGTVGKPLEKHNTYYVYTATEIQKCIMDFYAIDGIDITLSKYYNAKTNTVKVRIFEKVNQYSESDEICISYPASYTYDNGRYIAVYKFTDGKTMTLATDKNGRILSYEAPDIVEHKHMMYTVPAVAPTYIKTGLTEGIACSLCKETLTPQRTVAKLVLGKPGKIVSDQSSSIIKLAWLPVNGATGYEIFVRNSSGSWKCCATTLNTSINFTKLPAGKKYVLAVRAYVTDSGKIAKAKDYITIETGTKPIAPTKVISKQNDSAIRLQWAKNSGATGYRIYYLEGKQWRSLGETTGAQATFTGLKSGARFTFAIRPYLLVTGKVIWSENYATYVAATIPSMPAIRATAPSTGKISLSFGSVYGGEAYQVFYKTGDGDYKLFKNYSKAGTLNFGSLKSRTTYTFAVRAAKKTSSGWIFGPHNTAIVTVK